MLGCVSLIGSLSKLLYLDLRGNQLNALPESTAHLQSLEKLDLRWNQFAAKSAVMQQLEERGCLVYI